MKILYGYILREHVGPFFFGLAVITFVLIMDFILEIINLVVAKGLSAFTILQVFVSKTPCWPGLRPVASDVHAGGVKGGITERSSARTPESMSSFRKGITPSCINGSRIVKVAPSSPINTVRAVS